jgi:perosamine synthetase
MSSNTFSVLHANAIPVFADVDPEMFTISPKSVEEKITSRTKAIITVALYGLSPDMDPIMDLAKRYNLVVIEDDAQCFLGKYKGRMVGSIGDMASFSFQASKHITSGEGGMVIANNEDFGIKVRKYSCLGYTGVDLKKGKITKEDIQDPDYSRHEVLGWNYRMSDVFAAVALGQLERLEELVQIRKEAAKLYDNAIKGCGWLVPQKASKDYDNAYWTYAVKLEHPRVTWREFRDKYLELGGDGIYAAWKLTYLEPMFQNMNLLGREKLLQEYSYSCYKKGVCPVAEYLQQRILQFKTNYWDLQVAEIKTDILKKTIQYFN